MMLRLVSALLFSLVVFGCSSSSSDVGPPVDARTPNDALDVKPADGGDAAGCTVAPEAGICSFKAGARVAETLGSCAPTGNRIPVEHVILLMQENRSFDHYLGHLKGNGQDDVDVPMEDASNPSADGGAPVAWHHLDDYCFDDTLHEWVPTHLQWDQGTNDGFVTSNAGPSDREGNDPTGSRAMGYYDQRDIPFYYQLASTFAISDRYFCDLLGPTYPNRLYYMAASSFGLVQNDFDSQDRRSIFTLLNERQISWKVYASDYPAGLLLHAFANESQGKIASISQFAADAAAGTLPQVAWVDPLFFTGLVLQSSEHPPADMQVGQNFVYQLVRALLSSPSWSTSAMFITYDEHGGLYDHARPPPACPPDDIPPASDAQYGGFDRYGFRVPVFVVSPFAKRHFVSHAVHSHASILRFLEAKFDLPALSNRDANSDAMLDMFDFDSPPFTTPPSFDEPAIEAAHLAACKAKYEPGDAGAPDGGPADGSAAEGGPQSRR